MRDKFLNTSLGVSEHVSFVPIYLNYNDLFVHDCMQLQKALAVLFKVLTFFHYLTRLEVMKIFKEKRCSASQSQERCTVYWQEMLKMIDAMCLETISWKPVSLYNITSKEIKFKTHRGLLRQPTKTNFKISNDK